MAIAIAISVYYMRRDMSMDGMVHIRFYPFCVIKLSSHTHRHLIRIWVYTLHGEHVDDCNSSMYTNCVCYKWCYTGNEQWLLHLKQNHFDYASPPSYNPHEFTDHDTFSSLMITLTAHKCLPNRIKHSLIC